MACERLLMAHKEEQTFTCFWQDLHVGLHNYMTLASYRYNLPQSPQCLEKTLAIIDRGTETEPFNLLYSYTDTHTVVRCD